MLHSILGENFTKLLQILSKQGKLQIEIIFTNDYYVCFLGENSHLLRRKVAVKSEFHASKVGFSLALKLPNIKH